MEKKLLSGLLLATIIAIAMSEDPTVTDSEEQRGENEETIQGNLKIITITPERIEADFFTKEGGIHLQRETQNDFHSLSITSANGEPLVLLNQPRKSASLMPIMDTDFLVLKRQSKVSDYVVPTTQYKHIETALKQNRFSSKLLRQLGGQDVNTTCL